MSNLDESHGKKDIEGKGIEPKGDYILCEYKVIEKQGTIKIPKQAQTRHSVLRVLKVGEKVKRAKEGDRVLMNYRSVPVSIEVDKDTSYFMFKEYDIMATITDDEVAEGLEATEYDMLVSNSDSEDGGVQV